MHKIYRMSFAKIYPLYLQKVEKNGRTQDELNTIVEWLTGYDSSTLQHLINKSVSLETFFEQAKLNEHADRITGKICGVQIETIKDPLMKKIRYLDKIVDDLAKGKSLDKIIR